MTVYVDKSENQFGRMKMCHMVADTLDELHTMAARLGLRREWFQIDSTLPHYDICKAKRQCAIDLGAIVIGRRELVAMIRKHREAQRA